MTDLDLDSLSLEDLKDLEKRVGKAIKSFEARRRKEAIAALDAAAREHGYSLAELISDGAKAPKTTAPAKYRHPENEALRGSGRGRKPAWFNEALDSGKTEADLLIGGSI